MTAKRGFHITPVATLNWFGVDLDNTLAEDVWHPEATKSFIGDPIEENVNKLMDVKLAGYKIHIHTSRPWTEYEMVEAWLVLHEIPFDKIQMGKPLYFKYLDDRSIHDSAPTWNGSSHCATCKCNN